MLKFFDLSFRYVASGIFIILVVGIVGAMTYKAPSIHNAVKQAVQTSPPKSFKDQYRMSYTMTGDKDQFVNLRKGEAQFFFDVPENTDFSSMLLNTDGRPEINILKCSGPYQGAVVVNIPEDNTYIMRVQCNGEWTMSRN